MAQTTIDISRDFTLHPGPRYSRHGEFSGEELRERLLVPALKEAVRTGSKVSVILDGAFGYPSSFLEEAFGGLIRVHKFSESDISAHLDIVAHSGRMQHYKITAEKSIAEQLRSGAASIITPMQK